MEVTGADSEQAPSVRGQFAFSFYAKLFFFLVCSFSRRSAVNTSCGGCVGSVSVFVSEKNHPRSKFNLGIREDIHTRTNTRKTLTRARDCACTRRDSAAASSAGCRRCRSRGASWTVRRATAGRTLEVCGINGCDINYDWV